MGGEGGYASYEVMSSYGWVGGVYEVGGWGGGGM